MELKAGRSMDIDPVHFDMTSQCTRKQDRRSTVLPTILGLVRDKQHLLHITTNHRNHFPSMARIHRTLSSVRKFSHGLTVRPINTEQGIAPFRYITVDGAIGDLLRFDW